MRETRASYGEEHDHTKLNTYVHYFDIEINYTTGISIFFLSVLLAWASWKFVETPFCHLGSSMPFRIAANRRYLIPMSIVTLFFIGITQSNGLPTRFDSRVLKYEHIISTAPNELRPNCQSSTFYYDRKPATSCILGIEDRKPQVLLIGDSFANHFTGMIDVMAKNDNVTVTGYTMDGCMPVKDMGFGSQPSYAEKCKERNNFNYRFISSDRFEYVILAASWPMTGTAEEFSALKNGLTDSINTIIAADSKPIIILNNEHTKNANCPARQLLGIHKASYDQKQVPHKMRDDMFFCT